MRSVFRTDTLSLAAVRNLKIYATLAQLSRKLSNEIVRKSLLIYITNTITHTKRETVNGFIFDENDTSIWVGSRLHNEHGPAVIRTNGTKVGLQNGKLHRDGGPAVICADGYRAWYHYGKRHRTDGPAIIQANGYRAWYHYGKRHRTDGPAIIYSNSRTGWWQNGKRLK